MWPRGGRRWAIVGCVVLLVLAGLLGGGFLLLGRVDVGGLIAWRTSAALGRAVTVRAAHVVPGRWIAVEVLGVVVPNKAGGSAPVMAELRRGRAEILASSLIWGPVAVRAAEVEGLSVLLEHVADGSPNWRSGPPKTGAPGDRRGFPSLRALHGREIEVVQRTSRGSRLVIRTEECAFSSAADDQPVSLTAAGSYDGKPLQLDAALQPIDAYRRAEAPFGTVLHLSSGPVSLSFDGTMTQPMDLNGADGKLLLDAPVLTPLMALFGASGSAEVSLQLEGRLRHSGALWWLTEAEGALEGSEVVGGALRLIEGSGPVPDNLAVDVAFKRLDLNELLGAGARGKRGSGGADMSLAMDRAPGMLLTAKVTAEQFAYDRLRATGLVLAGKLDAGRVEVEELGMDAFGTRVRARGAVVSDREGGGEGGRVTAEVSAAGADVQTLRGALGFGTVPVLGRLEGVFVAEAAGGTLNQATRTARVSGVVAMRGGSIARDVVEKASTDIRSLFRKATGMSAVSCLLAGVDMRAGVGTVAPLRVRAADGTVAGSARFDLNRETFDLTIGSEARSTGVFALDVPVRVSGSFGNPSVAPATWSAAGRAALAAADDTSRLPPALREMVRRYPCPPGGR